MNPHNRRSMLSATLCAAFALHAPSALAQAYPHKPIRLIVPFTPGGGSDAAARFFGDKLAAALGQPVLVENRPGGVSGSIGTLAVKAAPADGYTLLVGSSSPMVINPIVVKDLPYDPGRDFKPIAGLTKNTTAIVVAANSPYKTLQELVDASRKDAKLNAGTASAGFQLAATWFSGTAGFKFTHVPYKGLNQVLTDLAGGSLDWAIVDLAGATPLLQSGRVRALAVTDEKRHPSFPEVPTVVESGFREYVYNTWTSFHVRTETSADVVKTLSDAVQKALQSDSAKDYARKAGTELLPLGPDAFAQYQRVEFERFQRVADAAGVKPQ